MSAVMERDLAFVTNRMKAIQDVDAQIEELQTLRQTEANNLVQDLEFMDIPLKRVTLVFGGGNDVRPGDVVHLMHQAHEGDPRHSRYWAHSPDECTGDRWCRGKDGEYKAPRGGRKGTRYVHARIGTFVCVSVSTDAREHIFAELEP